MEKKAAWPRGPGTTDYMMVENVAQLEDEMVKVAPASTKKCQSDICSITWTKNSGATLLSCPGDSSYPIRSRGPHTSWPVARESNGRNRLWSQPKPAQTE